MGESWKHLSTTEVPASLETTFISDDLEELLNQTYLKPGLRWRLNSLNQALGSLRKGDMSIVFARPETGKTTFLASEVTFMAEQTDRPILWLNNEEQGNKVKIRCIQAALGVTLEYLITNRKKCSNEYHKVTKGNIKLFDSGTILRTDVERIVGGMSPSLIIFDQLDKIGGFDADRNDLVMGAIYQWARSLAKEVAPVIGICQADSAADGQKWLTMNNMSESKVAKPGEADCILGIGRTYNDDMEFVRHFHLSKNKLQGDPGGDPAMRHGKWDTLIHPEIARFSDFR